MACLPTPPTPTPYHHVRLLESKGFILSTLVSLPLEKRLVHRECSINICCIKERMKEYVKDLIGYFSRAH